MKVTSILISGKAVCIIPMLCFYQNYNIKFIKLLNLKLLNINIKLNLYLIV